MAAPTITAATAAMLAASAAATGVGSAISAHESSNAQKAAALEAAKGPVRGGSKRAGNQDEFSLDPDSLEKLGSNSLPLQRPVYGGNMGGDTGAPIDLNALFKPNQFGQGYSVGSPQQQQRFYNKG